MIKSRIVYKKKKKDMKDNNTLFKSAHHSINKNFRL